MTSSAQATPSNDRQLLSRVAAVLARLASVSRNRTMEPSDWERYLAGLCPAVPCDAISLYLYGEDQVLQEIASSGGRVPASADSGQSPTAAETGHLYSSSVSLPLLGGDELLGFLCFGTRTGPAFDETARQWAEVATALVACGLQHHHDQAALASMRRQLAEVGRPSPDRPSDTAAADRLHTAAELAATINHQINNPLAVIVGNVQCLLLEGDVYDDKARERMTLIEKAALKISEVNRKLSNINRMARDI